MDDNIDAPMGIQAVAAEVFGTLDTGRQIEPFSSRISSFNLDYAYRVTAAVRQMRETRGEMPMGRKIGFTNRQVHEKKPNSGGGPLNCRFMPGKRCKISQWQLCDSGREQHILG